MWSSSKSDQEAASSHATPHRRSARRWMAVIAVAAMSSVSVLMAPEPGNAAAQACGDVLFVAVNGSGQPSSQMGAEVRAAYDELTKQAPTRGIAAYVLPYKAAPVSTLLKPRTGLADYFASLIGGASDLTTFLFDRTRACPAETLILAGYSQGAMIVHRVLQIVGTIVTDKIAGAILIADGDRVPHDNVISFGTATSDAAGIGQSFVELSHSQNTKFGSHLAGKVHSVCTQSDLVCDYSLASLGAWQIGVKIHTSYTKTALIAQAARAVATLMTVVIFRPSGPAGFQSDVHGLTCPASTTPEGMHAATQPAGWTIYNSVSLVPEGYVFGQFLQTTSDLAVGGHDAYVFCLDGYEYPTKPGFIVKTYRFTQTVTALTSHVQASPSVVPPGSVMTLSDGGGCGPYTTTPQYAHISVSDIPGYTSPQRVDIALDASGRWGPVDILTPGDVTATYWHVVVWCTSDADVWDFAADHSAYRYPDAFVPTS